MNRTHRASLSKLSEGLVSSFWAKLHFVCNYCHEIAKIDRPKVMHALTQHRDDLGAEVLEPVEKTPSELA